VRSIVETFFQVESAMTTKLDSQSLEQLFLKARTHKAWTDRRVSDQQLRELY
jgi:hypothetical protein